MPLSGAIVVFVLGWWICFFAVLPIGVRGQWEDGEVVPGSEEGAPARPMLLKKVVWASLGALVLTGIAALIIPMILAQQP